MFALLMVIGLVGLAAMAIPAFGHGHGALSSHGIGHGLGHGAGRGVLQQLIPADAALRFVPSPRAVFSVLALYGAFGNAAVHAFHLSFAHACLAAVLPALLVERALVRPLWNLLFRIQAPECSPLEQLVLGEALAVVPFRNGRGMVSTVRDGRRVQLVANLRRDQAALPVKVGDRLRIEEVDAKSERVVVSLFH